ncbi:hypothetical protein [Antrihabitans spumae]|uniref:Uncharacterized protein n=1 Tax=Antrihabitans spumae TaxID=3373370 RepID=A0ABW7KY65_9NOCA
MFFVAALAIERLLEPLSNALLPTSDKKKNAEKAAEAAGKSVVSARKGQSQLATLNAIKREFDSGAITLDTVVNEAERLPLPNLKPLLTASRAPTPDIDAVKTELTNAVTASKGVVEKDNGKANDALKTAAVEGERLRVRQLTRTTAFWVLATVIGMLAAATMKLYFLNTVGITAGARWQEILATGLILGAGTQPLHSLTTLITKKAEKKEDEPGDDS